MSPRSAPGTALSRGSRLLALPAQIALDWTHGQLYNYRRLAIPAACCTRGAGWLGSFTIWCEAKGGDGARWLTAAAFETNLGPRRINLHATRINLALTFKTRRKPLADHRLRPPRRSRDSPIERRKKVAEVNSPASLLIAAARGSEH
jgi:hypothetical protein